MLLGSKTLSGHNDRNLGMRTWVRSAVFVPRVLCSNLKVRFFWDTLYIQSQLLATFVILGEKKKRDPGDRNTFLLQRISDH